MPRVGRPEDEVWRCYTEARVVGTRRRLGKCKGCGQSISGLAYRLRRHADRCLGLADRGLWKLTNDRQGAVQATLRRGAPVLAGMAPTGDQVTRQLARTIYSLNLPFKSAADPQLRQLLAMSSPGVPSGALVALHFCLRCRFQVTITPTTWRPVA